MLALLALLSAAATICAQDVATPGERELGALFVRTFTSDETGGHVQNFAVAQDGLGRIVLAHAMGVTVFDGERWLHADAPQLCMAVAVAPDGRPLVGSRGDFGWIRTEGPPEFVSFTAGTELEGQVGFVHMIRVASDGSGYFLEQSRVYRVSLSNTTESNETFVFETEGTEQQGDAFTCIDIVDDRVLVVSSKRGLIELRGDRQVPVPGCAELPGPDVEAIRANAQGHLVLFTNGHGMHVLGPDGFEEARTPAADFARTSGVRNVSDLDSGRLLIGTRDGAVVVAPDGTIERLLTEQDGLTPELLEGPAWLDRQGGLWVPMVGGVAHLELGSPFETFDAAQGLEGVVLDVQRHAGRLYVATLVGLFVLEADEAPHATSRAVRVAGSRQTWSLLPFRDRLLVAGANGVHEVLPNDSLRVVDRGTQANSMALSHDGASVLVGSIDEVLRLTPAEAGWQVERWATPLGMARNILQDKSGAIWLAGHLHDMNWHLVRLEVGATEPVLELYGPEQGVPEAVPSIIVLDGELYLGSPLGLWRFDSRADRFEPDLELGPLLESVGGGAINFEQDATGALWFWSGEGRSARARRGPGGWRVDEPLRRADLENVLCFHAEPSGVLWAGSVEGRLLRFDESRVSATAPPAMIVRGIADPRFERSTLANGSDVPFAGAEVRFEFGLPSFDGVGANQFQTRLEGFDETWAPWSDEPQRDFGRLLEGRYAFEVRGRDAHGRVTEPARLSFRVFPPWYRTWWAYTLGALAALATVFGAIAWRTRSVTRRVDALELEIAERERAESALRESEQRLRAEADEHERTNAERAMLEGQLRESQKMEAIGRLAGGLSHDFNNILTAVLGSADLALSALDVEQSPDHAEVRENLDEIQNATMRAADLTRQLLAYSSRQVLLPEIVDPNEALERVRGMLRRLIPENIELAFELADDVGCVSADPGQLEQVIVNLIVNAKDAMPDGGRIEVRTSEELVHDQGPWNGAIAPGAYVCIHVRDSGHGIDAATLENVFDPFFTTKPLGKGTGLGLASVRGIVKQSGGHVLVESEVGVGTAFRVYFPSSAEPRSRASDLAAASAPVGGSETVLVCDDDGSVRRLVEQLLVRNGYSTLVAESPERALEVAHAHEGALHLLLTDVVMPGISGLELARLIREQRPDCAVLLASGYATDAAGETVRLGERMAFLAKPFGERTLLERVRSVLGSSFARA